ncbi:unnamed protein product, partial [Larinioides sclopetarius]
MVHVIMERKWNKIEEIPFFEDESDENSFSLGNIPPASLKDFIGSLPIFFLLMMVYFFFVFLYLDGKCFSLDSQTDCISPYVCFS